MASTGGILTLKVSERAFPPAILVKRAKLSCLIVLVNRSRRRAFLWIQVCGAELKQVDKRNLSMF